ncbi:MAG TPA: SDR family NAD(P)-dependent oxidoreductase [Ornithinimicrobium sp.]|uniref:SDR family NAD(P)-dependent oxidoreductase n=1 Tax=Ornithinimicrobium sp. TaxID=1977084 RepID=UPI002B47C9A8|nr:SDR family NAD(P)-dependent oxidoreductase [Ornithinimicrobium sp.]HKJ11007.1 SDR family NAD(P)-dependent oxidoreductase [Ornithinimicrobium sp.]
MGTALVTGASAGLGRAFAIELAARGHDVVLVARDEGRLQQIADELRRRHGVHAEALGADLADRGQLQRVADRVGDAARPVDLVVNNAGFGIKAGFVNGDIAEEERALDVMVRAVMVLSHAAAEPMRRRGHGAILNVSSVASFATVGTYSADKAWTTVFSEGLSSDLAGSGVTVTALCPGFIRTEFHDRAQMNMGWLPEGMWLDAHRVALDALHDVAAGHVVSVPSLQYRLLVGLARSVPRPVVRRVSRRVSTVRR